MSALLSVNDRYTYNKRKNKLKCISSLLTLIFDLICSIRLGYTHYTDIIFIETPHTSVLNYDDTIFLKINIPFLDLYYTIDGTSVKENGKLYTNQIYVKDLNLKQEQNTIIIAYQANFLGLIWFGQVEEKEYAIDHSKDKSIVLSANVIQNYPTIHSYQLKNVDNVVYRNIAIVGENAEYIQDDDKIYAITDGNSNTIYQFDTSINHKIKFFNSNNKSFQKMYIRGGKSIQNITIETDYETYKCVFPDIVDNDTVVEIDFNTLITTDNIWIKCYSSDESYFIGDIWIDYYITN